MELRDFAERVLFSDSLEEKLLDPGEVTDERPGKAIVAPSEPGRPGVLRFKPTSAGKQSFLGDRELGTETGRGRLLHFFANHELLATELMALVLLRFPDAPPAFRAGVLRTLRDEQEHTRLYLERMRACGIGFGELGVSGYFWRAVAPMEHPIDFVAGLSLTFEQANLDHSRHFAARFATVGDGETAALLGRIHRDEIAHVAHGLKWFRRWKDPASSDWDALCRQLKFPLSPARARGPELDAEARIAAGLEPDFVERLRFHVQSKGRAPTVWTFNPFGEGYLARGRSFAPVRHQTEIARDLEVLPAFLARRDDVVLVERTPSNQWMASVVAAGFALPEFVELRGGRIDPACSLPGRKISRIRPWGWAPDSVALLGPLAPNSDDGGPNPTQRDPIAMARLHSKATGAEWLGEFLESHGPSPWLCTTDTVGRVARSATEATALVKEIRAGGHHRVVVKESLGLAGANAIRLWEPELLPAQRRWMEKACASGRTLVVEPWLERLADFSLQLEIEDSGARLLGFAGLEVDARGQYVGNRVSPSPHGPPRAAMELLRGQGLMPPSALAFLKDFAAFVGRRLAGEGYRGPAGIDAFVYRDSRGASRLKPLVEINPRHTMGRVAIELMRGVCPGSEGTFRLARLAEARADGNGGLEEHAGNLETRHPLRLSGSPRGKIREGTWVLNDPSRATVCLAVFEVRVATKISGGEGGK